MTPCLFRGHDINPIFHEVMRTKGNYTEWEETRNGRALAFTAPVLVQSFTPQLRVLFDPIRDCNPFFHYMESIWMLSGSENVDFPARYAKQILQYSDDGTTLHGAYGYRWRYAFERDQIDSTIAQIKKDPKSRRIVIAMWDPHLDMEIGSKDLPCNTHIYFRVRGQELEMTVLNRSNDIVWGMLGANFVHMSLLHEYIAAETHLTQGSMYQFSNNAHIYEGFEEKFYLDNPGVSWYEGQGTINRLQFNADSLDMVEARAFVEDPTFENDWRSKILTRNAVHMQAAHVAYKNGDFDLALHNAGNIYDDDWREACVQWLQRRMKRKLVEDTTNRATAVKNTGTEYPD